MSSYTAYKFMMGDWKKLVFFILFFTKANACGNLAFGQQTNQSSNANPADHLSSEAVNGDKNDFTETNEEENQWWMVDLGDTYNVTDIELYRKHDKSHPLEQIYVLSSIDMNGMLPSLDSSHGWLMRFYHEPSIKNVELNQFPARYVAVFSKRKQAVVLAELEVYAFGNASIVPSVSSYVTTAGITRNKISINFEQGGASTTLCPRPQFRMLHPKQTPFSEHHVFEDLNATTNYTFQVKMYNETGKQIVKNTSAVTGKLPPQAAPGLSLTFDENCVFLSITSANLPNEESFQYKSWCNMYGVNFTRSISNLTGSPLRNTFIDVCNLDPATRITCGVKAINSAGKGPPTILHGYTFTKVVEGTGSLHVIPPVNNNVPFVSVKLCPVKLMNSSLRIKSYRILVGSLNETGHHGLPVADIDSDLVKDKGYIFNIGDGRQYGGYNNKRLEYNNTYSLELAIRVQLPQKEDTFCQHVGKEQKFRVPPEYCTPPQATSGAEVGRTSDARLGETVLYSCKDGYPKIGGDSRITCLLADNYTTVWSGDIIICSDSISLPESSESKLRNALITAATIMAVMLLLIVSVPLGIFIRRKHPTCCLCKKRQRTDSTQSVYYHSSGQRSQSSASADSGHFSVAEHDYITVISDPNRRPSEEPIYDEAYHTHGHLRCNISNV